MARQVYVCGYELKEEEEDGGLPCPATREAMTGPFLDGLPPPISLSGVDQISI
jgi:hypothetical protein